MNALYQPYKRFDYKTPGAGQRASGFTPDEYNQRAGNVFSYESPVMPGFAGYHSPIEAALSNHGDPAQQRAIGAYGVSKGLEKNNLAAQNFMLEHGVTAGSTPDEMGAGLDAYQRSQQERNQRPKRSLWGSLPFQLATSLLGGAFFGPAIGAGLKGLGAAGTGIKLATGANALANYGKHL